MKQCLFSVTAVKFEFACLLNLVKSELQGDFFRYFGGLTTPSCNEVVQWTVFTKAIGISASQVSQLRLLVGKRRRNFEETEAVERP